jgi:cytochrome c peroxidase
MIKTWLLTLSIGLGLGLLVGCGGGTGSSATTIQDESRQNQAFKWDIPTQYPLPVVPASNPMTEEKFQLGRYLFYDQRLSGNGTQSCASCHQQDKAFTDGLAHPLGATGEMHPRHSQALVNVAYNASVNWGNPTTVILEQQPAVPLFGEFPVELGVTDQNKVQVLQRLKDEPRYAALFNAAFAGQADPINFDNIILALASFVRGLTSFNSPLDSFEEGNTFAISEEAKRGRDLFFDERTECFHCHDGFNFSLSTYDSSQQFANTVFFNNGLYNVGNTGAYPEGGQGIFEITGKPEDMGRFRPPTLRNIAVTAPYMHDGSITTLEDVVRHYNAGGRNISAGVNAGDGRFNPYKSSFVREMGLSEVEVKALVAFLQTLTDQDFLTNPRYANPWGTN